MNNPEAGAPLLLRGLAASLAAALGTATAWALVTLPPSSGLRDAAAAQMPASGVAHPVTAVLLNFRGYDTLLEVAVLLLALIATWSLRLPRPPVGRDSPGLVLQELVRLLVPLLIVLAGYLLWLGAHAPGGAFQAGALLAGAGVLLTLVGGRPLGPLAPPVLRGLAALGVAVFLAVALIVMGEGRLLEYPRGQAGLLILLIEAASTVSIGLTLAYLFRGDEPAPPGQRG
jgi:multisubunit Na+/H+ antiporter MnhB subunit